MYSNNTLDFEWGQKDNNKRGGARLAGSQRTGALVPARALLLFIFKDF
jgi:hypothetical protein